MEQRRNLKNLLKLRKKEIEEQNSNGNSNNNCKSKMPQQQQQQQLDEKIDEKTDLKCLEYQSKQNQYKLIINSIYGGICSRFFEIGNTILGNVITSRARTEIWLYSRAMQGIQCITDGFGYQPAKVFGIRKDLMRKNTPSLKILSDFRLLKQHRYIKEINLGGINWENVYQEQEQKNLKGYHNDFSKLNELATIHITEFLENYNLAMNYQLDHKMEKISKKMFYIKKANYCLQTVLYEIIFKFRGYETRENPPMYTIAINQLLGKENEIFSEYTIYKKNSINDYLKSMKKGMEGNVLIPGFIRQEKRKLKFTNDDMSYINSQHYKYRNKKQNKKDYADLIKTDGFEKAFNLRNEENELERKKF